MTIDIVCDDCSSVRDKDIIYEKHREVIDNLVGTVFIRLSCPDCHNEITMKLSIGEMK